MAVVTHLAGLPGRRPGDLVRAEVVGDALAFRQGVAPLGWSHYVPLATVALVQFTPADGGARLTLTLARRRGPATIILGGAPAALAALESALGAACRAHRARRGARRRPPAGD